MSSMPYQPPPGQLLNQNPQLPPVPETPGGSPGDSEYLAQEAILRAQIMRAHSDILQQLGYMDSGGQFVPGQVEIGAQRQGTELNRQLGLAGEDVTNQMRGLGTLFSGRRGTEQARAEHPFVQALGDLAVDVPKQLSQLYQQGSDLSAEYVRQRNLLLIDAAKRKAAALADAPPAAAPPGAAPPPVTPPVTPPVVPPVGQSQAAPQSWENPLLFGQTTTGIGKI